MNHGESLSRKYPITVISKVQIDEHHDSCHLFIFIFMSSPSSAKRLNKTPVFLLEPCPQLADVAELRFDLFTVADRSFEDLDQALARHQPWTKDSHASSSPTVILET